MLKQVMHMHTQGQEVKPYSDQSEPRKAMLRCILHTRATPYCMRDTVRPTTKKLVFLTDRTTDTHTFLTDRTTDTHTFLTDRNNRTLELHYSYLAFVQSDL